MTYLEKLKTINEHRGESKYAERICSQLVYLDNLSELRGGIYDKRIEEAADRLLGLIKEYGVITAKAVYDIEDFLSDLAPAAKSLKERFIAHAHIDMNWQWGYNETASVTIDTFRTILTLMREYPELTFAQSQASTYEIVAKYRPDMLEEIKERIHEGRWEVTAAEWVEPDKNMPSGESLTRQILEAKKYLTKLLDIPADKIAVDFVPDTFGHAITVPEILADAGIKYMYHCRGYDGPCFYNYRAPSGKQILAYKEFGWYNRNIETECFENLPRFCKQEKLDTYLCVYGVGDHGGGPTRRDVEKILEFKSWPLTPDISFGTYREFFETAERSRNDFPVVDKELNFVFSGCYTTQSRIKMANRIAEARAFESETLSVEANLLAELKLNQKRFEEPWRNILFGHFHDIIPGSGTIETREHALGKFQDTLAELQINANTSMYAIAEKIDTSSIEFDGNIENTRSEGAGVGYGTGEIGRFVPPSAERGRGKVRAIHIFNPTAYRRNEFTEITVWDYFGDNGQTVITDAQGKELRFTLTEDMSTPQSKKYWGHTFKKYLVEVDIPAFGYTTVVVKQKTCEGHMKTSTFTDVRTDFQMVNNSPIVMENENIYAVFDRTTMALTELTDKRTGEKLIDEPSCFFRYIEENPRHGYAAWRVGDYMKTVNLNEACAVRLAIIKYDRYFKSFTYTIELEESTITATVTLKCGSEKLDFDLTVDWKKDAKPYKMIPQLSFVVPVSYKTAGKSLCEIPYGRIERDAAAFDVPSHGALGILGESKHKIAVIADTKYGFRHFGNEGQVTLLRNAYSPDPYSDRGIHNIHLGVAACKIEDIDKIASTILHPLPYVSGSCQKGCLPTNGAAISLEGNVRVSSVKGAEDGCGAVVRVYDVVGKSEEVTLSFAKELCEAYVTDTNENIVSTLCPSGKSVKFTVPAYSVVTVKCVFND